MQEYSISEIKTAYLKLKHYVYFDNSLLFLRARLAEFEAKNDFEDRLLVLANLLSNTNNASFRKEMSALYNQIDFKIIPKSFLEKEMKFDGKLITNKSLLKENSVVKINYFIDCPIELHIISVLWIIKIGFKLEEGIGSCNYGYRLDLKKDLTQVTGGLNLYKSYITQYPEWRNNAIKKAKSLIEESQNAAILGLDIKRFFHSVLLDFNKIKEALGKSPHSGLTVILKNIHDKYTSKINEFEEISGSDGLSILPIGLLSSGLLANWYLQRFDNQIIEDLNPAFYGRYVDDIIVVVQNPKVDYSNGNPLKGFMERYFIKNKILSFGDSDQGMYQLTSYPNLFIQSKKIALGDFDSKGSKAVLDKFEKNVLENASEFNYLPEDDMEDFDLDEEVHTVNYAGSLNKLWNISDIHINKFEASKFIAKCIYNSLITPQPSNIKTGRQIVNIFKGTVSLEFHNLWEKIAAFFVISEQHINFLEFIKGVRSTISSMKIDPETDVLNPDKTQSRCIADFLYYFKIGCSMAFSLNPDFLKKRKLFNLLEKEEAEIVSLSLNFRKSNLLRHHYVKTPALTYTDYCTKSSGNLLNCSISNLKSVTLDPHSEKYSPRYVPLSEMITYNVQQLLSNATNSLNPLDGNYHHDAFNQFFTINYEYRYLQDLKETIASMINKNISDDEAGSSFKDDLREKYFKII